MKKLIASILFILLLLTACQPASQAGTGAEPEPTQAPAGGDSQPAVGGGDGSKYLLDPANADETSQAVNANIYETLVKLVDNQPVGQLTDTGVVSEDGLSYTFQLERGVSFHDGTPFNADAVVANFNRWFDPQDALRGAGEYAAWKAAFGGFKGETEAVFDGIEKVDEYTVLIHLNKPDADFITKLADPAFSIASPAALTQAGAGYGTMGTSVAGTGPYKVKSWTDDLLTLEPNPAYPGGTPTGDLEFK